MRLILAELWKLSSVSRLLVNFHRRPRQRLLNFRMLSSQASRGLRVINKRITELIRSGRLRDARSLFDNIPQRNTITWNSMLIGYVRSREIAKARKLFDQMPERNVISWNLMISGYMSCHGRRYVEEGRLLFDNMPERDFVSWNTMISGYARNARMDEALKLFNGMPERNVVSWNAMITGFLQNGDVKRAGELFKRMPERDGASLRAFVSGLIENDELDMAAKVLFEYGKESNKEQGLIQAYNTLIAAYGQNGRLDDARRLFDQIPVGCNEGSECNTRFERNLVSWNSMIMAYVKTGNMVSARGLFDQMGKRDTISWNTMISGYVHILDMKEAAAFFSKMPSPDTLSWNSMISGYAQVGKMDLARYFFERMPQKDRVTWNSMIAGCERNAEYREAIEIFFKMQAGGEKPDRHTLSSLLSICAETAARDLGIQIHQLVTKVVIPDVPLNNSLITMYARCGAIAEAKIIFYEIGFQKNVISWNAIIGGYASHGFANEALKLFELMKQNEVRPTYITFIAVLNACAHAGLVEYGRSYFKSMISEFGIKPGIEHYSSLVDILGRYGLVKEAMDVITSMPFEPDKSVWGAVLAACRMHNSVEFARVAADALMRLEPESPSPYILLYNMYVDAGRWDDANEIRMIMEKNSIQKERGYSMVNLSCS